VTRERILHGLDILILQLANGETSLPEGWDLHEWTYVKGIASAGVTQVAGRLRESLRGL
jgi:hypothetical protein